MITQMSDEADARRILTASPARRLEDTTGTCSCNVVQDYTARPEIKETLPRTIDMAQNRPLCRDYCLRLALRTPRGACQKKIRGRRKQNNFPINPQKICGIELLQKQTKLLRMNSTRDGNSRPNWKIISHGASE